VQQALAIWMQHQLWSMEKMIPRNLVKALKQVPIACAGSPPREFWRHVQ